jgi:hypothetical protein
VYSLFICIKHSKLGSVILLKILKFALALAVIEMVSHFASSFKANELLVPMRFHAMLVLYVGLTEVDLSP